MRSISIWLYQRSRTHFGPKSAIVIIVNYNVMDRHSDNYKGLWGLELSLDLFRFLPNKSWLCFAAIAQQELYVLLPTFTLPSSFHFTPIFLFFFPPPCVWSSRRRLMTETRDHSICLRRPYGWILEGGGEEEEDREVGKLDFNEIWPHRPWPEPAGSHMVEGNGREVKKEITDPY